MLTPEYLDVCAGDLVAIYSELDQSILALIAARIAKTKFVGDASKWQIERLQEAGLLYEEVIAAIARYSGISQDELRKMFAAAGVETITADNAIYTKAGLHPTGIKQSPAMTQVLRAGLKKTGGSLKNLTMTTAMTAQTAYINASNLAYMQITSGAMSMPEAVRHAVRSAAKQGTTVRYPSGHTDQLDVAVRRASVTGVNQTCAEIQLANAEDMGCNHVETTAHIGARPSHAEWQGRVFMIVGSSREYPNLAEATGYGTGDGLCGWNCRHNFFPFFEGIDLRTYRDEDLEKLKNDGYYEAEQKQRYYERQIRATKRELAGYDAAIAAATDEKTRAALQQEFDRASVKLKKQEGKLKDWIKEKELTPDPSRVQVNGFGRSVSQKAVWANKTVQQNIAFQQTLSDRFGIDAKGFETYRGSKTVLDEMVGTIEKLHADFPDDVGKMKLRYADLKNAEDFGQYDPKTKAISLNRQLFDNTPLLKSEYERLVQSGHFPKGTDYKSVIVHEFGHQYDFQHDLSSSKILKDAYHEIYGKYPSAQEIDIALENKLSQYSTSSLSKNYTEAIAESFSQWYNSDEKSDICVAVMERILGGSYAKR